MQETGQDHSTKSNSTALVLLNTRNISGYKSVEEMVKPDPNTKWGNQFGFIHVSIPELTRAADEIYPTKFVFEAQEIIKRKKNSAAVFLTGKLLETLRKYRGPEVHIYASFIAAPIYSHNTHTQKRVNNLFLIFNFILITGCMSGPACVHLD